jgi:hypothetical protein
MAERTKATVLKTVARKRRGFESLSLRKLRLTFIFASRRLAKAYGPGEAWTSPLKFDKIRS